MLRLTVTLALAGVAAVAAERGSASDAAIPVHLAARPVQVISREALLGSGHTELPAALAALVPALRQVGFSSQDGADHVAPLHRRGFAADQTTFLINGRRRHPTALLNLAEAPGRGGLATDLAAIPLGAVARVELYDGTGAGRHGSGAVGLVLNVVLADTPEGLNLTVRYGLFNGEISGVPDADFTVFEGPDVALRDSGDRNVDDGDGDTVFYGVDWGFRLGEGGGMRLSADYHDQDPTNRAGFDRRVLYPALPDGSLDVRELTADRLNHRLGQGAVERLNAAWNGYLPLGQAIEAYGFSSFSASRTETAAAFRRPRDAANLPAVYPDGYLPLIESDVDDAALTLGLRGRHFGWHWDFSFSRGENEIDWGVSRSLNVSLGPVSPTRFSTGNNESRSIVTALEVSRPFAWARLHEPVTVTAGVAFGGEEYEIEWGERASYINGGAPGADGNPGASGAQGFPGFKREELEHDRDTVAAFLQVDLSPRSGTRVSAAVRYDDLSDVGGLVTGQLAASQALGAGFAVRGAVASSVRAPDLAQSHYERSVTVLDGTVPLESGTFPAESPPAVALGGARLDEERATSLELGVSFAGSEGLRASVDAFQVDVDDRVLPTGLFEGAGVRSALAAAGVDGVAAVRHFANGADTRTRGVRARGVWAFATRFGAVELSADLDVVDVTVRDVADDPAALGGLGLTRFAGADLRQLAVGQPDSRLLLAAAWRGERADGWLRVTRAGEAEDPYRALELDAQWVVDARLRYQATPLVEVALGANNLLDSYPDTLPQESGDPFDRIYPFSAFSPFGINGRFFYLQIGASL